MTDELICRRLGGAEPPVKKVLEHRHIHIFELLTLN